MSDNSVASAASSSTKAFFGGLTGTLGVLVALAIVVLMCCCSCFALSFFSSRGAIALKQNEQNQIANTSDSLSNSQEETKIVNFNIGDKVSVGSLVLTVDEIIENITSDNKYYQPEEGNKFIAVNVKIDNAGQSNSSYLSSFDFTLQDSEAYKYSSSWTEVKSPAFKGGELKSSESTRGWINFEVPSNSKGLKLIFSTGFWPTYSATVNLN